MSPQHQLRLKQIACISFLILIFLLRHFGLFGNPLRRAMNFSQSLVIVAGVWSFLSYFMVQRRHSARPRGLSRRSPLGEWMVGHLIRFANAVAVGRWGLLMHFIGGPPWLVDAFLAGGLILLLIWKPGLFPDMAKPNVAG
jgi:hypothetical protein